MNLEQLTALLTPKPRAEMQQVGGALAGYRAPNTERMSRKIDYQQAFIPGISHHSKYARKRKKKAMKYLTPLQKQTHDVLVDPHIAKRRKYHSEHELDLQKEKTSDFLANAFAGYRKSQEGRKIRFTPEKDEKEDESGAAEVGTEPQSGTRARLAASVEAVVAVHLAILHTLHREIDGSARGTP